MKLIIDLTRAKFIKAVKSLKRPEIFFVSFASVFGTALVFITPPMQSPDEQSHFYQAYAVSNLDFVWDKFGHEGGVYGYGAQLPKSIFEFGEDFLHPMAGNAKETIGLEEYEKYIDQELKPEDKEYRRNGTSYSPVAYLPQAVGIWAGKALNGSPLVILWLGRLANLAFWVLIVYFSIKILPSHKWLMAVLALNPVAIFLSASLSADVIAIALAFLFISVIISAIASKGPVTRLQASTLGVILVALTLTKPVNILFALLLLVIPWKKFGTKRNYASFLAAVIAVTAALFIFWNALTNEGTQVSIQFQRPGMGISPSDQLMGIFKDLPGFISLLIKNYVLVQPGYYGDAVLTTFFGSFGWLDTFLPVWVIILYIFMVFLSVLYGTEAGVRLNLAQKTIFIILFIGLCFANILAMYLIYTPVGQSAISGVQGRYFLPASSLLVGILMFRRRILQVNDRWLVIILGVATFIIMSMTVMKLILRYYV